MSRNEAAERLRISLPLLKLEGVDDNTLAALKSSIDAALAKERSLVIAQIRERLESHPSLQFHEIEPVLRILVDLSTPEHETVVREVEPMVLTPPSNEPPWPGTPEFEESVAAVHEQHRADEPTEGLDVLRELESYARTHGALGRGYGNTDDVLAFIDWYKGARLSSPEGQK